MLHLTSSAILREVMDSADRLPPFPNVIQKVMPLLQKMAPVPEIEAVIKYDQAIVVRVLALSQSAYYSRGRGISSLRGAIVNLGQRRLVEVLMVACSASYYGGKSSGYDLKAGELWQQAVASALMAEMLGKRFAYENGSTLYMAALLHDIGKTVLSRYVQTYWADILPLIQEQKLSFVDAEKAVFGIDHQQVGAMLARNWHLPTEVTTAIGYHHTPHQATEHRDIASIIYVADRIVLSMGIASGVDAFLQPNRDEVFTQLGITTRMVEQLMADLLEALEETNTFLSLQ